MSRIHSTEVIYGVLYTKYVLPLACDWQREITRRDTYTTRKEKLGYIQLNFKTWSSNSHIPSQMKDTRRSQRPNHSHTNPLYPFPYAHKRRVFLFTKFLFPMLDNAWSAAEKLPSSHLPAEIFKYLVMKSAWLTATESERWVYRFWDNALVD